MGVWQERKGGGVGYKKSRTGAKSMGGFSATSAGWGRVVLDIVCVCCLVVGVVVWYYLVPLSEALFVVVYSVWVT